MIVHKIYECEICRDCFDTQEECFEHKIHCKNTVRFMCDKCGEKIEWDRNDPNRYSYMNQIHMLHVEKPSYGSKLDGMDIDFEICDDCLNDFVISSVKFRNIQ